MSAFEKHLADDGFTDRVIQALPPRRSVERVRRVILGGSVAASLGVLSLLWPSLARVIPGWLEALGALGPLASAGAVGVVALAAVWASRDPSRG